MFLTAGRCESATTPGPNARSPEALLVMMASPCPVPGTLLAALQTFPPGQTADLLQSISYHRIDGLAHRALAALPDDGVDAWLRRSLRRRREKIAAATLSQGLALAEVLESFHRAGLPVVVMRGLRSVEAIYGEPGARPFQDHDLLVSPADREAAESLLGRQGFEQPAPGLHRRGGILIDLHVDPLGASRRPTRAALFPLTTEAIFAASRAGRVAGSPALVACREDEILLDAIHLIKHSFDRLIRVADLAHVMALHSRSICWQTLERRAAKSRTRQLLVWALEAASLLGAEVPESLRPAGARGLVETALMRRVLDLKPFPFTGEILMALGAPTLASRARFLMDALLPAGEAPAGTARKVAAIPRRASALLRHASAESHARRLAR